MKDDHFTALSREALEQQIERTLLLLADEATRGPHVLERELERDLQDYYAPSADQHEALQRVWRRFHAHQQAASKQSPALARASIIHLARRRKYRQIKMFTVALGQAKLTRYVGITAIVTAFVFALGSLVYMLARHNQCGIRPDFLPSAPGNA
ncbi:MAG TPA: hypothetical protein VL485_32355 [Ktedonobacteraceae bacterium]|jgi:hypothetical protein|nr:hypothetical protein [Ktedonobacteraceae bacterium]